MPCIEEDVALALIRGEGVSAEVKQHIATCETCREFVAGLARVMVPDTTTSLGGWGLLDGQLEPGTQLGDYVVESMLGRGGMGVVYAAHDTRLDRAVAIKLLRDDVGSRRVARLRREAASMAKLSHPNVAEVFDFGESDHGPFVVMERIRGETLVAWVGTGRSTSDVIAAYSQAARGLAAAHRAGLVHRDFKPSNAMVVTRGDVGRVKVLDFGLAADFNLGSFDERHSRGSSTLGGLGGTPRYASPEQMLGRQVTPRSDQFSFCVAMFEALSGRLPFPGDTGNARRTAMLAGKMAALPGTVPDAVAAALARGLEANPQLRFPSMAALLEAFASRRSRATYVGVLVVAAVGVGGLFALPSEQVPCADGTARMHRAWPRPRDSGWTERPELLRAAAKLDERVAGWLEVRAELCAKRAEFPLRFERGTACLEHLASRIHSTGERLVELGDAALPSNLLGGVDDPERCYEASKDVRVDQLLRDEFDELFAEARGADADGVLEPDERSDIAARAGALHVRAVELGDTRVQGQLALLMGTLAIIGANYADAERRLQEGYFVAELSGDRRSQLQLAGNLVMLFSDYLVEPERAIYWAEKATDVAAHIGTDNARGRASLMRGAALLSANQSRASLSYFDAAEPLLEDAIDRRYLLHRRARAYGRLQQTDDARADLNEVIHLAEETLGPHHPELASPLNTLATLEIIDENFDVAMATLERVLSLTPATDRLRRALVRGNLAILLQRTGDPERALEMFQSIAKDFEDIFGLEHEETVRTRLAVVEALADLGRKEESLREVERLLDRGIPDSFLSRALFARASVVDDPRPDLERILTLPNETESTLKAAREGLAELEAEGR